MQVSTQNISPAGPASGVAQGILWMLIASLFFVSLDTAAKYLTANYPVLQVVWARYLFHFLLLTVLLRGRLLEVMRTNRPVLQLVRSCLLLLITGLFFAALRDIAIATASAIMFLAPILVTALSVPLLKEKVGPRRWASVVIGFLGALVIIRPTPSGIEHAALLVFAAASCYSLYQIATRVLSRSDSSLTTLAYTALVGALIASFAVPFSWRWPDVEGWFLMLLLGLFGGLGHFAMIRAFTLAPASTVTPFGYASLIWATLSGLVVFGELPDLLTYLGAAIIIASGLYIYHREHVRRAGSATAAYRSVSSKRTGT